MSELEDQKPKPEAPAEISTEEAVKDKLVTPQPPTKEEMEQRRRNMRRLNGTEPTF